MKCNTLVSFSVRKTGWALYMHIGANFYAFLLIFFIVKLALFEKSVDKVDVY